MQLTDLPTAAIQNIGTFLGIRDRNSARCAGRVFLDIHAGVRDHTLVFHGFSMHSFRQRCKVTSEIMPCLQKLIIVFKNIVGHVMHVLDDDLCVFDERGCKIEVAFEYCDETFMISVLNMPWKLSFAYIWFHNETVSDVVPQLREVLRRRNISFSSRFNSKQAPSLLSDASLASQLQAAHYVVHGNHFTMQYSFMEPPHTIDIPTCIPDVSLELLHYNVLVVHPERIKCVSFIAQDFNHNDLIESNRDRLMSWFRADKLAALQGVDIYTLSFTTIQHTCFARHVFETLKQMRSKAVVRIYNCIQSNCMCLIQQYPEVFVVLVAKTDHTYLIGMLVMHFLGKIGRVRLILDDSYEPRDDWVALDFTDPRQIYAELPAVLKDDWYWVQFIGLASKVKTKN